MGVLPSDNGAGSTEVPKRYAVIVDAGSSGSRVHVFSWPDPDQYKAAEAHNKDALGAVPPVELIATSRTKPGVSSYAGSRTDRVWDDHLRPLIQAAEKAVPADRQFETPVFFLATAGMRLLREDDQKAILAETCARLQQHTGFYVPECSTHVSVIDGETEGLFGWLALNYLLGTLSEEQPQTYGFMDMGGASAQIAFAPNATEAERHADDLFRVSLRSVAGEPLEWDVFLSTWLGFGANRAYQRLAESLVDHGTDSNPCVPRGLDHTVPINGTVDAYFTGGGSFDGCMSAMVPLLNKDLPCKDDPCLFNGQHVPAFDFKTNKFVGVSEFWYTANDVYDMGGKYDFVKFSQRTREFCETPWADIVANAKMGAYNGVSEEVLRTACFKSAWVISILHDGFGIPYSIDGSDSDAVERANTALKRAVTTDKGSGRRRQGQIEFLDPFQSAVDVNGVELSWALGRALFYASAQVQPASDAASSAQVGYIPAGATSRDFVGGGELASSPAPYPLKAGASSMSLHYLWLLALLVLILASWAFNLLGPLKRRVYSAVFALVRRVRKRTDEYETDNESAQRLMEEGIALKSYPNSPSGHTRPAMLGSSTSMLDLNSRVPSRVSSRLSMRPDSSAHFTLG